MYGSAGAPSSITLARIRIARPDSASNSALSLDGHFQDFCRCVPASELWSIKALELYIGTEGDLDALLLGELVGLISTLGDLLYFGSFSASILLLRTSTFLVRAMIPRRVTLSRHFCDKSPVNFPSVMRKIFYNARQLRVNAREFGS
jgi:hypothetical protein